jgi:hypothetical protein
MCETHLTLPELGLIAGTRAALGAGLALLLGDRLPPRERKVFGWALLLAGAATTIPLAIDVLGRSRRAAPEWWTEMEMAPPSDEARVHRG